MHELSIAMSIVELAEEESSNRGGVQIKAVHLQLGGLAGVVKDALLSSFELAREGTALKGACLTIEEIPVEAYCPGCQALRILDSIQWFACPECKSPVSEIVRGRELQVVALEIEE